MGIPLLDNARYLVIVKRGEAPLLLALGHFMELVDNVEVIWDRRVGERRSEPGADDGAGRGPDRPQEDSPGQERRGPDRRQGGLQGQVLALLLQRPGEHAA
jgi:hypothetical protein